MFAPLTVMLIALCAILAVVTVRRVETARGARYFDATRTVLDRRALEFWEALVMGGIPVSWRSYARAIMHDTAHLLVRLAVETVRALERPLVKLSYKMRVTAPKSGAAPVSEFLKTLSPEKK